MENVFHGSNLIFQELRRSETGDEVAGATGVGIPDRFVRIPYTATGQTFVSH
jgi:hypothetical protein